MNLYWLRAIYKPKSIAPYLGILDELEYEFSHVRESFLIVKNEIVRNIYEDIDYAEKILVENCVGPRAEIYFAINEISLKHLATGRYHIFRGEIADFGPGPGLCELNGYSAKKLYEMGCLTKKQYLENRQFFRKHILPVG